MGKLELLGIKKSLAALPDVLQGEELQPHKGLLAALRSLLFNLIIAFF